MPRALVADSRTISGQWPWCAEVIDTGPSRKLLIARVSASRPTTRPGCSPVRGCLSLGSPPHVSLTTSSVCKVGYSSPCLVSITRSRAEKTCWISWIARSCSAADRSLVGRSVVSVMAILPSEWSPPCLPIAGRNLLRHPVDRNNRHPRAVKRVRRGVLQGRASFHGVNMSAGPLRVAQDVPFNGNTGARSHHSWDCSTRHTCTAQVAPYRGAPLHVVPARQQPIPRKSHRHGSGIGQDHAARGRDPQ